MPDIRLDKTIVSSLHPAFVNYDTPTGTIIVSATPLSNGSTRNESVVIPYTRGGTVSDIYATRGSVRTLITGGGRAAATAVYNFKSTETANITANYSSSNITVTLSITNNTGGSITPNAQTITISVVQYDAPITSI